MNRLKDLKWGLVVMVLILLDQGTKYIVQVKIPFGGGIAVIQNFFYLTYWKNTGAAWGILRGNRIFLIVVTILAMFFLFFLFTKYQSKGMQFAVALIAGGAFGNLIDRIFKNGVVDFLHFQFGIYAFPAFNVADICIVVGTFLLVILTLFFDKTNQVSKVREE